ncbi:uncharacterized protein LOC134256742, partial [Saccostrea cucullata]|uniref:uncharacterized protein LOC134256742 n=1 Tax=Saccostrea cuccullata TaxID=36930 RepID=UPI002ED3DCA3
MAKIQVNIKFSSSSSCPLEVSRDSSVREIKSCISDKTGIPKSDLRLILAGKLLQDGQSVSELGLGNHTTLHAFQQKQAPLLEVRTGSGLNQFRSQATAESAHPYQFYVYCKKCTALQPGKLRVVCGKCLQGNIILHQVSHREIVYPSSIQ